MDKTRSSSQTAMLGGKDGLLAPSSSAPPLAERRTTWLFIRTLLWKNWTLKRRHPVATFMEVALPCVFILIMGLLKSLVDDVSVPQGWSDDSSVTDDDTLGTSYNLFQTSGTTVAGLPAALPKFTMHETSLWGILLYMGSLSISNGMKMDELSSADLENCTTGVTARGMVDIDPTSAYAVPTSCAGKVSPYKIAIAPDNTFTRDYFMQTMELWYPRLNLRNTSTSAVFPSLMESFQFFDTEEALEEYVSGNDYASSQENPHIYGGIVFDSYPEDDNIGSFQDIEYTVRLNSTLGRRGAIGLVPRTSGDPPQLSPFQKDISMDYYTRYTITGFMTLQTLVTRFVACMPEWDAATKTTTGVCQRPQTTAEASKELDDALLSSLDNDVIIDYAIQNIAGADATFSSVKEFFTNETLEALLKPLRQTPQPYLGVSVMPFPIEAYISSPFYDQVSDVFAIVFILSYLYSISRILVVLIQEKELRLREYMKILGVKEKAIVVSWYMTYTLILFVGSILQALMGMAGLFSNSSVVLIFLFFFLFSLSVLAYGFMISTIFSKARVGAFVGMVLFFLMYFVSAAFTTETAENQKTVGCILSPVALSLGVTVLSNLEATGTGVNFSNASVLSDNFRFSRSLLMFAFDTVLYTLLGLYFEKVVPKEHGTTLKWYFPVSPSYWRNRRKTREELKVKLDADHPSEALLDSVSVDVNHNIEPVNAELREQERQGEVLAVQRLRKVFPVPGGEKVAVQGLNLTMYKNQITCLLGHNGAGKTTLISMLTGMIAPTSGDATFRGLSVKEDMDEIRESLGLCFQHDVLFEELTVEEHLLFFGRIKGYTKTELDAVITRQIREVGLTEKRHVKSTELSGGMKRKLSVAVSLLGDSSLVFLDEPTSGMDPYSRRSTWEILLNNRNDRVMVLTTHFMDEADILGDRIAIMAEGELRCCGSSLFLKNRFGAGYNLTLVKDDATCKDSEVISFVTSRVPTAQLLSNVGSEVAFQLPLTSSSKFASMFADMDDNLQKLGLLSYGVSVTTLEEVFIKVAEADDHGNQHTLGNRARPETPASSPTASSDTGAVPEQTSSFFMTHLWALFLKRFRYAKRDKKMIFYSLALPILLLLVGLGLLQGTSFTKDDPNLPLTTDAFDYGTETPTPYFCQPGTSEDQWCSSAMGRSYFTDVATEALALSEPAFDSSSPTVFGVTYTNPAVNTTGATGYGLRLGEEVYNRGYGVDTATVEGQYGAYLVHADSDKNLFGYNIFVNTTATHGAIIFKALMDQTIYRFFAANSSSDASNVNLVVNNHPLPLTADTKALFGSFLAFTACLFICIAFTYYPASIVVFLVKEKQASHNSKHQQLVSGVSLGAFWLSNFLWDFLLYLIPCAAAIIMIKGFGIDSMTGSSACNSCTSETFPAVIVLLILFGLAICPFTYCLSYLFKEHASSQTYTIMINFVLGVVLMVVAFILDVIESTKDVNAVLVFFWRFSPLFNLGYGLLNLVLNELTTIRESDETKSSPFSTDLMGWEMIYLFVTAILYGLLAVGIDYAMTFPKVKDWMSGSDNVVDEPYEEDVDVVKEAERVANGEADGDIVKLAGLRKVYRGGKVAVRNLSFGLKRGECFGFLGINGAGKTTTMKMLTGDELPTHGTATLGGFDILTQQIDVRRQIGYCPQFDALFELLTVREHLELFASIKGVPRSQLNDVVVDKISQLNLGDFENKLAGSLSGGNKRKLSVAIAMIGNPRIIFLDEPSTGMDPVSRRFMWDVIADISTRGKNSTIVLTTHSMEESEALCSRVGIMVGGRLRCLGSVQHLKSRFGDGLVFDVKLANPSQEELDELVHQHFGGANEVVTRADLEDKCRSFSDQELAQRVVASHPTGYGIAAVLERDGYIRAEAFLSWCLEETRFDALLHFLSYSFSHGGVTVMERQNDFCRFKLRGANDELWLSKVFALVEDVKEKMHIREYSVSQTSLEQIFNYFASQQAEEQGVARGFQEA
ncbi:ABC transporter lipid export ABCA family [Phytophthora sojae]|uniref:ABC transporter lipid export ABCA family n=1 Tax=Phytophthora sojae (strain P6497) TaxID=1094619 RepID=G4ZAP7_PHYSP|nr:ABC transporter lipid export ABCA family [Phytophthora sojae]EGZ19833.1 ABC transporter lipid export ABCA family [Phytophthora sojae]|eukprot:XP_009522550.1 ABC transporter lipid export ABCA family [Phytophthora sojae]